MSCGFQHFFFFDLVVFFFKQKTAYEMRISDWSSDVCSSDLRDSQRSEPVARPAPAESPSAAAPAPAQSSRRAARRSPADVGVAPRAPGLGPTEIGRASCRERVCQYV